jgi:hypothetical protein
MTPSYITHELVLPWPDRALHARSRLLASDGEASLRQA